MSGARQAGSNSNNSGNPSYEAIAGHIAIFDINGQIVDSGIAISSLFPTTPTAKTSDSTVIKSDSTVIRADQI
jgi:hypothetical protein